LAILRHSKPHLEGIEECGNVQLLGITNELGKGRQPRSRLLTLISRCHTVPSRIWDYGTSSIVLQVLSTLDGAVSIPGNSSKLGYLYFW